ncbi:ABC transporter ATP-binding protein [Nissabacter sp. SGAir0207]|uniref:ABC transporter ATP-binding protein n=1 Tax=Nissabacter sp. SGAir0207 TaxID=2126321 RepID=UPI0010CCD2FE|nr:ATP-binding cassette domain-containing protein [Nissabacter sp. SGAir0207]QCR38230.1 ABC transporter ATP-binding protein [Nissabacter sp. SGAir0207]
MMGWLAMQGVSYQPGRQRAILEGIDLQLAAGERVGLIGRSGSGKSTLLHLLLALQPATCGNITCEGRVIRPASARALRPYRRQVQFIPQEPGRSLPPGQRVSDILHEPLRHLLPTRDPHPAIAEALGRVGLPASVAHQQAGSLSGGQAQRVAIARALIARPRFLLADEPVSGLDMPRREQVIALLAEVSHQHGMGLLMVSHDISTVATLCERTLVMEQGQIVEDRPTRALLAQPHHPSTRALLDAVPRLAAQPERARLAS